MDARVFNPRTAICSDDLAKSCSIILMTVTDVMGFFYLSRIATMLASTLPN